MGSGWDAVATALVTQRGPALARYAYLLTGSREDAADLVQEALVRTFGTPRPALTLPRAEAYVRRAILNAVIDRSRRETRWRGIRHLVVPDEAAQAADASVDDRIDLAARIRRLAPRQAACIVLRYYEDLTVDGIADVLGISPGAVKRYLSDGLAALSSALDPSREGRPTPGGHRVRS